MATMVATLEGRQTKLDDDVLETLRTRLRGPALTASDPGYEQQVREVFNAMHTGRPALTVRCSGTADMIDAVSFAREHGLLVAVRGGGTRSPGCRPSTAAC